MLAVMAIGIQTRIFIYSNQFSKRFIKVYDQVCQNLFCLMMFEIVNGWRVSGRVYFIIYLLYSQGNLIQGITILIVLLNIWESLSMWYIQYSE